MADQPRMPKRWNPKLRSSCDGCGAAKLKCDREQPECGRCVSHGMQCVYGFSRKMGKPPRDKLRATLLPASSEHPEQPKTAGSTYVDRPQSGSDSSGSGVLMDIDMGCLVPDSRAVDVPGAWDTVGDNTSSNFPMANLNDGIDDLFSFTPVDFASLEFGEWGHFSDDVLSSNLQFGPGSASTPESSELKNYLSPGALTFQQTAHQSHTDDVHKSSHSDRASIPPPDINITGHDCPREAYGILGSLAFHNLSKASCVPNEGTGSARGTGSLVSSDVPLDCVLRLNREASERLSRLLRLLNCSCARSPHLALLYASIISRVLTWYQEAANCMDSASCSPIATALDMASHHVPTSGPSSYSSKSSGSRAGPFVWSSTATSSYTSSASGTSPLPQSAGLAVAPTKMAIGTFDVDDLHVQIALKIQLLLGEMRRAGRLIELFITSHNTGGECLTDKSTHGGIDSLYISLDSWLKGEHSTISNMMRLKLRELST
ncbi:hypothetical protein V499_03506 [Pseudogymnoascus sp. VKM F-103]|uniref:Zn(2)-C6 fungal-type domain-containing protein n=1 Tax=Pseudogymnoascus verrucosus TaxID=342668 RepID=A0A1B8GYG3_9PEZI|nr:uncharacterized protein VE01_01314 [Pseudogymnoascus verrucosus]KFY76986.1 hypothetical protein V499_03506 [Pseudogymnoascus sp. VKM F-103]OBU00864.1 hypothetical protein VE01_01314 [Pseudogymnoascus verrucosus]